MAVLRLRRLLSRVAAEHGLDISQITGTGPEGRVTETDVRAAMKSQPTAPATRCAEEVHSAPRAA